MKVTLKKLCAESHLPESLILAVVRQIGGWESFAESARDVTEHGADAGFGNFCYYSDTVPFAERNKSAILESCREMARDLGAPGAYSLIADFNCLRNNGHSSDSVADAVNNKRSEDYTEVMNALAWYALEEVSRSYCDALER